MAQSDIKIIKNKFHIISKFFKNLKFEEFNFIEKENINELSKILIKDKYLFYYKLIKESEQLSKNKLFNEIEYSLNFELNLINKNNSVIEFLNNHIHEEYNSNFVIFNNFFKQLNEIYKLKNINITFKFDLINEQFSNTLLLSIRIFDKIDCDIFFNDDSIHYIDISTSNKNKNSMPLIFFTKNINLSIDKLNALILKKLFKFLNYEEEEMSQEEFINLLEKNYDDLIKLDNLSSY